MRIPIPTLLSGIVMVLSLMSTADAGNMGFRYSLDLTVTGPTVGLYWIAIPYVYTPPDAHANGVVDAEDLVQDLQHLCQVGFSRLFSISGPFRLQELC